MRDGLISPLDFIEEPQSYEGFRGQRGRDSEGNSVTLEVKSQVPGQVQMCRVFFHVAPQLPLIRGVLLTQSRFQWSFLLYWANFEIIFWLCEHLFFVLINPGYSKEHLR